MTFLGLCQLLLTISAFTIITRSFKSIRFNLSSHRLIRRSMMMASGGLSIRELKFDNRNLRELPIDSNPSSSSRPVPNAVFARTTFQPVRNPDCVAYSSDALALLGLDADKIDVNDIAQYLSGNKPIPNSNCEPYAHCYCGHQFGSFAGQLGDGAAMYLGEVENAATEQRYEVAMKGSGKTPFSRRSDGRKVLRSSIREFLGSEAMHYLGIPTTRAGSIVTSQSTVVRDVFYDGHAAEEPCSVITRIAPNFFRFGSFEIFKKRDVNANTMEREGPSAGNLELQRQLFDYIISNHFKKYMVEQGISMDSIGSNVYTEFFRFQCRSSARLVSKWDLIGFIHGVLNTDNMSLMGITIDYGPYAFMEWMDQDFTPNGSDSSGRYAWEEQREIVGWNLMKLYEALSPVLTLSREEAEEMIEKEYQDTYKAEFTALFAEKIGALSVNGDTTSDGRSDGGGISSEPLLDFERSLRQTMHDTKVDFTDFYRALTIYHEQMLTAARATDLSVDLSPTVIADKLLNRLVSRCAKKSDLVAHYEKRMKIHKLSMPPAQIQGISQLIREQPAKAEEMFGVDIRQIAAEISGEEKKLQLLIGMSQELESLKDRDDAYLDKINYNIWRKWIEEHYLPLMESDNKAAEGMSQFASEVDMLASRVNVMHSVNPTFILRNWINQECITAAEKGSYDKVRTVLEMLKTPYRLEYCTFKGEGDSGGSGISAEEANFAKLAPTWGTSVLCTCSS